MWSPTRALQQLTTNAEDMPPDIIDNATSVDRDMYQRAFNLTRQAYRLCGRFLPNMGRPPVRASAPFSPPEGGEGSSKSWNAKRNAQRGVRTSSALATECNGGRGKGEPFHPPPPSPFPLSDCPWEPRVLA